MAFAEDRRPDMQRARITDHFHRTRQISLAIAAPLSAEDQQIQSMDDVSPTKWHLAHVTWFWETFLLGKHQRGYEPFDPRFDYLFNSYYVGLGKRHGRPRRGLISRPPLDEVHAYRAHVDAAMGRLLDEADSETFAAFSDFVELGCAHEEQHQELMLMDIKHVMASNPFLPAAYPAAPKDRTGEPAPLGWVDEEGGLVEIGQAPDEGFGFDNEQPRHKVWLEPYRIADRPVTQGDWADFIADGGYETPSLWLSDGWAWVQENGVKAPLYWGEDGKIFTLHGEERPDPHAPVCHLTFYEAVAYANWANARLPTEAEWEAAAESFDSVTGDYMTPGRSAHPARIAGEGLRALSGGVWEWTRSAYQPYPGFKPFAGEAAEYNGKFMCGQYVMRGGCAATPAGHARRTYRNFFYPSMNWQFGGLRLARDV